MKKIPILLVISMFICSFSCDISLYGWNPFSKENKEEQEEVSGVSLLEEVLAILKNLTAKLDTTSKSATAAESTLGKLSNSLDEKTDHGIVQLMASEFHETGRQCDKISVASKDISKGIEAIVQFSKLKKEPSNSDIKKKKAGITAMKVGLQKLASLEAILYKNRANTCILLQGIISKAKKNADKTTEEEEGQVVTEMRNTTLTSTTRSFITAMGDEITGMIRRKTVDGIEKQLTLLIKKLDSIITDATIDEEALPLLTNYLDQVKLFMNMHTENLQFLSGVMTFLDNNITKQMEDDQERVSALLSGEQAQQDISQN